MLAGLAHVVHRRRRRVIALWFVLTAFGLFATARVSDRWFESFSIPGYSAYETNQKILKSFGTGEQAPLVAVFQSKGDVTKENLEPAIAKAAAVNPGSRVSSYFDTHSSVYVSKDKHTTFAEMYPAGENTFTTNLHLDRVRNALADAAPQGVTTHLTGLMALYDESSGGSEGPSVLTEALIGGAGALVILLFVFGTLPAVAMPLAVAVVSILNTFTLVWVLTYLTDVSIVVQFLIALVGLGVAIDYALLMIFRFREELAAGEDVETALTETMTHAGRSVIVSGTTVAVGLLSMIILPLPFIRSIGIGGMLIPAVSVLVSITLLPALLSVLGTRINKLRVMPKRFVAVSHPETGWWGRWARLVVRRPWPVAAVGAAIVAVLLVFGLQLNPSEAQAKDFPGKGDAAIGRDALTGAGISPGVIKPFVIRTPEGTQGAVVERVSRVEGVEGAAAPPSWRKDGYALVEAFASHDGSSKPVRSTINRVRDALPPGASLGGVAAEDRDFVHAVYGNFPYVLLFVILLSYVLLARAFRSLLLPLKAVILNLVSLGAAYGIIVFIFQQGHGSEAIWNVPATQSIIPWIPLMIFAFLFGLSMDYEVFMLTRMREAYDETRDTRTAISLGLARTGKLVTSAALVLMFAFFVLSTSPGTDIKQFGIGLAAGIIFDATVIRALLVPALVRLMGRWNWWLPHWAARPLRTRASRPVPESA
ncbi:MAG TPA: MMPL family transporter [Actinomycetota bacterium]|jgi:RND superfamily putative drug exporter|nr:MMPL family transporter [Actinomycetota bacterium]